MVMFDTPVSDPDGGTPSEEWFVAALPRRPGPRSCTAVDGEPRCKPGGGRYGDRLTPRHERPTWFAEVVQPDNDGDLWRPPADCDDANALVNPDRFEIEANGLDDDCDPSTVDGGPPPPPLINSVTKPDPGPSGRGSDTSMELDVNGFPIIAYRNNDAQLKVMHCNDVNCAGQNETIATQTQGRASRRRSNWTIAASP